MKRPMIMVLSLLSTLFCLHISDNSRAHAACPQLFFDLTGPSAAAPGEMIGDRLKATVENRGDLNSGALDVRFYFSPENTFPDAGSIPIEETGVAGGVPVGPPLSVGIPPSMMIPPDTIPGQYHLFMIVAEPSLPAGCAPSPPIPPLRITVPDQCPDLLIDIKSGPGIAAIGEEIGSSMFVDVKNNGNIYSEGFNVRFYLSKDTFVTAADSRLIGETGVENGISPETVVSVETGALITIPPDTPPGQYNIVAVADEANEIFECNEENNVHHIPITIEGSCPDLTINIAYSGANDPALPPVLAPEEEIGNLITATIMNTGDASAASFTIGFFLSADNIITDSDIPLVEGSVRQMFLFAGDTISVGIPPLLQLPSDIPPGTYFLGAIIDQHNEILECDENNNVHGVPITIEGFCPDLAVNLSGALETDPSTPFTVVPEQVIGNLVSAFVSNQGNEDAGAFTVGFYLSTDSFISPSDILLPDGKETEPGLPASNIIEVDSPTLQIPAGISPGDYFLGVFVDDEDIIFECDENNNIDIIPIRIEEAECSAPDLWTEINEFSFDRQGNIVGSRVTLTIFNRGQSPAADFSAGAYLSDDDRIDQFDFFLPGSRNPVPEIPPGESVTLLLDSSFELPPDEPLHDTAFLGVMVDAPAEVDECDEFNNSETVPLCESPLITPELRLILPWVIPPTTPDTAPVRLEMALIPWKESAAFELTASDVNPPGNGAGLCGRITLTADGFMHIPRFRFTSTGIVALTADLQLVPVPDRTIFEIVDLEILP